LHKGFLRDEKFKGNLDIGNLILDISTKNRICGIEILNATKYLKDFRVDKKMLSNLKEAQFNANKNINSISLSLLLKSSVKTIPAKIAIPLNN